MIRKIETDRDREVLIETNIEDQIVTVIEIIRRVIGIGGMKREIIVETNHLALETDHTIIVIPMRDEE